MAQGKIVVEESPLTTFFNRTLPDWSMNLLSMQARMTEAEKAREFSAAEAEKQRDFQESQTYLKDLLSTKRILLDQAYNSAKIATSKGINLDNSMQKLAKLAHGKYITPGQMKVTEDAKKMFDYNSGLAPLASMAGEIQDKIDMADLGIQYAHEVDVNNDGLAALDEILTFEKQSGQRIPIPEDFRDGANTYLGSKEGREKTTEFKELSNALNSIELWDMDPNTEGIQLDPNVPEKQYSHRRQAVAAIGIDNKKVKEHVIKSQALDTTGKVVDPQAEFNEQIDLQFRNEMQNLQNIDDKMSQKLLNQFPVAFTQDFTKGSVTANLPVHKENIEKVLEKYMTGATKRIWTSKWLRNLYTKYNDMPENTGTDSEKRAYAVSQVLSDPIFINKIETTGGLEQAFGVKGGGFKEKASDEYFLTLMRMYNLVDKASGVSGSYDWLGEKTTDTFQPADESWIYDIKTDTMLRKADYEAKYPSK